MGDLQDLGHALRFSLHQTTGPLSIGFNTYPYGGGVEEHRHHDFAEVFWVVRGRIRYVWHGQESIIGPGFLQFIDRDDHHRLEAIDRGGCTLVNLSIHQPLLTRWRQQRVLGSDWPWDETAPLQLDHRDLTRLQAAVATMPPEASAVDHLWLVAGVVRLAAEVRARGASNQGGGSAEPPPEWLVRALRAWRDGEPAADVQAVARHAKRSREHVARTVRRHFGVSPSTLLNHLRCDRAAAALRATDQPVLALALDCGFSGLGHFYRCFQARFGCAPRRYRDGFRGV